MQPARWIQVFVFALLCCGLATLNNDLSRPRGACCTPLYWNHDAAIRFSALWCLLVLLTAISTTQKIILRGNVLQVGWLWGAVRWNRPVEQIEVQEIQLRARGAEPTPALRLKLGWMPLYVTPDFEGYREFRLGMRVTSGSSG